MSDSLMASVVADDSASLYDLEYRGTEDDAWYSVYVFFDAAAETLTVRYMCSPVHEDVFKPGDFETEARLEELLGRFRPVSRPFQDSECLKVLPGTAVCASHGTGDDDLRYFDAVVDAVEHRPHSFVGGEEECLCNFVLYWQHGRGRGTLTPSNIASICALASATEIDPRLLTFAKMVVEKIVPSKSEEKIVPSKSNSSTRKESESSKKRPLKSESSMKLTRKKIKTEDSVKVSNYESYDQWTSNDEDMGQKSCRDDGYATTDGLFLILIDNLEKDLSPSSIENFIFEKTAILPEAHVFPRHLLDPFARGVLMVDCRKKAQTIQEFLDNPNHMVISSRGRPWITATYASARTFGESLWNLIPAIQGGIIPKRKTGELELVLSGTEKYKKSEQLRNLMVEFLHHESEVTKELALEEKKILLSFQSS